MSANTPGRLAAPIEHIVNCISCDLPFVSSESSAPSDVFTQIETLSNDDWDNLAVIAIALGLAPLLHWRLERASISPPPMTAAKLGVARRAHARRNQAIARQLTQVLAACAEEKLGVLVLKGALLASTVYPEPALRPMNDIDLLFRPQDLAKAGLILESLGYVGKHKKADQGPGISKHLSTYRRNGNEGSTPNPYLSPGGDRMIEPHGSLEEAWFGLKVDITPGVWERAVPVRLHGQPAYRLSTADTLLHLSVHAAFHVIMGASVFIQLYDIGQVIKTWTDGLDWSMVLSLTEKARAQPFVYAALYWAKTIFDAPIPRTPILELETACSPKMITYVKSLDAVALFKRTQHPPLMTLTQRLRRGIVDRWEAARWADSVADKWRVWQTALAFYKTDTAQLLKKGVRTQG